MKRAMLGLGLVLIASLGALAEGPQPKASPQLQSRPACPKVEVVFCMDTTGSMGGLIRAAQDKVWEIINSIATRQPVPEVRVGLVAYRDRGDSYITRVVDLTNNLDAVNLALYGFSADGGGDDHESVNQALNESVLKISWSPGGSGVYRAIFLVGDWGPHMDYAGDVKYAESCKIAREKGIVINAIRCGNVASTETTWRDIAGKAGGGYASIEQSGGVKVILSPYDAWIAEFSARLVQTGVYAGPPQLRQQALAAQQRAWQQALSAVETKDPARLSSEAEKGEYRGRAAAAASTSADASLAGMGMGSEVGQADLVAAYARDGEKALAAVKEADLPPEMQKMTAEQRKSSLEKKLRERRGLLLQIEDLAKLRAQFIQEEKKGEGEGGFDEQVVRMIQEQERGNCGGVVAPVPKALEKAAK